MRRFLLGLALGLMSVNTQAGEARGVKVTNDRTVDASSLESIVRDVFRLSNAKTDDERAIALYEYLHSAIFHHRYPTEPAPQSVGPMKVLNAYGWSLCGGEHTLLKALFETAGWPVRYVGWEGHTTVEAFYGGRWHYFDVFLKCYYWSKDRTHVVDQAEIAADPSLALDAVREGRAARQNLCCGDAVEDVVKGVKGRTIIGDQDGTGSITGRDRDYSPLLNLPVGGSLRLDWRGVGEKFAVEGPSPRHTCGLRDYRDDPVLGPVAEHYGVRGWSGGEFRYEPDFARAADMADVHLQNARVSGGRLLATAATGTATFRLPLPYPYVGARATVEPGVNLSVSTDGGRRWNPVVGGDLTPLVKQRYDVRVKAEFGRSLGGFRLVADIEHNRSVLPHLLVGRNTITVEDEGNTLPAGTALVVRYAFEEAAAPPRRERWDGRGLTYQPTRIVTERITSLPRTFTIEVGGNTPPRMISMERSIEPGAAGP